MTPKIKATHTQGTESQPTAFHTLTSLLHLTFWLKVTPHNLTPFTGELNGEWTGFVQRISNHWLLKALYNMALHTYTESNHTHTQT